MMWVNGKVSPTKEFTCVTVFIKKEKIEKKINKAYYGRNENVTHENIFVGGSFQKKFPFPQVIFMQS